MSNNSIVARISGITLPKNKRIEVALTSIFGIGRSLSRTILKELNINLNTKVKDLTDNQLDNLRSKISGIVTEGDLRRKTQLDIKHHIDINSYRGNRHKRNLPVRGQGTKKNARTRKGKRKTVANKKIATK